MMKTFMRHLIGFVCCAGLLMGCSHLFYPKARALNDIRQGMSPKEVIRTLGNPDYKRINYDLEEWEYNKMLNPLDNEPTVTIIRFENGRLVYMDSFKKSERPASLPEKPHRPHKRRP